MILIIRGVLQTPYFSTMLLLLTQQNMILQVFYSKSTIEVLPLNVNKENEQLQGTIARNEERQLHAFLKTTQLSDPLKQLTAWFARRGWQVQRAVDLLTPVPKTVAI